LTSNPPPARDGDGRESIASRVSHLMQTQRRPDGARYTTRQIAAEVGCSHAYIANIANGKVTSPAVDVLVGIARFFHRDPAFLIPESAGGFSPATAEIAHIAFRASRLDRESLLGVQSIISAILAGDIPPDNA